MSATVHELPMAPLLTERLYEPRLLGRRVVNRNSAAYGRLSGDLRYDRGLCWFEVECETGRWWWPETSVKPLGEIPVPCPRGNGGAA